MDCLFYGRFKPSSISPDAHMPLLVCFIFEYARSVELLLQDIQTLGIILALSPYVKGRS